MDSSSCHTQINENAKQKMIIIVISPTFGGKRIRVKPTARLSDLFRLFPYSNFAIFYQGLIQSPNKTFFECQVGEGDQIVIIPQETLNFENELIWKNLSKTDSHHKEMATKFIDLKSKFLFSRLNDLKLFKAESRAFSFRQLIRNLSLFTEGNSNNSFETKLDFPKLEAPNSTTLPLIFQ